MAYAEPVKSPKGTYWRGRYKDPEGRYVSVRDEHDRVIRFDGKREARKAAEAAEADVSAGRWRDPKAGEITFLGWANNWYRGLDLAPATMANRKRHLENHLIPFFGEKTMREIEEGGAALVLKWERAERDAGKSAGSIKAWRGTLHLVLEDARGMHISVNPATRKKGRGKRSGGGRSRHSGPEKAFTTPLGVLLIAERMSILTGRDDEFVMVEAKYWEVLRLGELVGLEKPFVRQRDVRVEWQLSEVDGVLLRVPPKDDSFGNPVMPLFMRQLLTDHMRRVPPERCTCHGQSYLFRGYGVPKPVWEPSLRKLALLSGIPEYTIRRVLSGTKPVSEETRKRVLDAAERFGLAQVKVSDGPAWHWRRSAFESFFTAAASGWWPLGAGQGKRPVLLRGDWPGVRVTGQRPESRAELCWAPAAPASPRTGCATRRRCSWRRSGSRRSCPKPRCGMRSAACPGHIVTSPRRCRPSSRT